MSPNPTLYKRLHFGSDEASPAPSLLLDDFPNAAAAYSASRQLDPDQVAAMDVRESGGDTEATINYSGGVLDEAALLSHCGANDGLVAKFYDSSGNAYDVLNGTAADQPKIVEAGVVVEDSNVNIGIKGGATDSTLLQTATSSTIATQPNTIFIVGQKSSAPDQYFVDSNDADGRQVISPHDANKWMFFAGGQVKFGSLSDTEVHVVDALFNGANSNLFVDGSEDISDDPGPDSLDGLTMLNRFDPALSRDLQGTITEVLVYDSDISERSEIRQNLKDEYGVA